MIKDENYYTVCGWMLNRLHLTGNDLIVYALIYSFSQDGESEFKGSRSYIQDFTGLSKRTIQNILDRLVVSGYIKKQERNSVSGTPNGYMVVPLTSFDGSQVGVAKIATPRGKNCTPPRQKLPPPVEKIATNIDNDNYRDIKDDNERKKENIKKTSACAREKSEKALVSHADIMDEYKADGEYREVLEEFLRACYLRGHLVTNEELKDILERLYAHYGDEDEPKILSIRKAIAGGFNDILELREATGKDRTASFRRHLRSDIYH